MGASLVRVLQRNNLVSSYGGWVRLNLELYVMFQFEALVRMFVNQPDNVQDRFK